MPRYTALFIAAAVIAAWCASAGDSAGQIGLPLVGACRHDAAASAADRLRRDQAIALARAINTAEGLAAQRTRQYQPIAALPNLPPTPAGFRLRLYADSSGYVLSLKDERDPCHYGIFSDEEGQLYEMSPQVPRNAS